MKAILIMLTATSVLFTTHIIAATNTAPVKTKKAKDSGTMTIQVVNNASNIPACAAEANSISLFYPPNNQQLPMAQSTTQTITIPTTFGKFMFGIQDNGWYWRKNPSSGQNPDNAGMQVTVSSTCGVTTSKSWGGAGTPDARKLLTVSGTAGSGNINCVLTVTRIASPTLCVTKSCCGPGTASGSCSALNIAPNTCN